VRTRAVAAELIKIRTLPAAVATASGTVLAAAALAALVAAGDPGADAVAVVLRTVPLLQAGPALLGVLAVASEYAGTQVRTTLTAIPDRTTALLARTVAFLVGAAVTSAVACAVGLAVALAVVGGGAAPLPIAAAALDLVLIGLLAHALALLLRALVPALVGVLALVFVVPPLLAPVTEQARWLPGAAGRALYLPGSDAVLTPGTGALVLVAWVVLVGGAATWAFRTRDA
jgi:ABC-2 type transport system permease protein